MHIIKSTVLNPIDYETVKVTENAGILVKSGNILDFDYFENICKDYPSAEIVDYSDSVITPGFIDLHTHIPQLPAIGIGKGALLPWLKNNIFPLEKKFADYEYAFKLSEYFFKTAISLGTTTIVAFSSLHKLGTQAAIDAANNLDINAYIGKVMMDLGDGDYFDSLENNIYDTINLIDYVNTLSNSSIEYIITPRYAGSCSLDLLRESAKLAKEYQLSIQTHLAENIQELDYIATLHPCCSSYTDVYRKAGILDCNALFAHCIYLSDTEIEMLKESNANIIHCPSSNRYLMSGRMNFEKYLNADLKIGLGTDVAAGYSLSISNEMREALETSGDLYAFDLQSKLIKAESAFFASTLGSADILKNNKIGKIESGRSADLIVHNVFDKSKHDIILNQIIYGNSTIQKVIIKGEVKFSL